MNDHERQVTLLVSVGVAAGGIVIVAVVFAMMKLMTGF